MDILDRRKIFGRRLRDCRKKAHITQADLAKALGYDSSQLISNIERGVSLLPSKRIPDFARALSCSLLEMEIRYFQCSAKTTSESKMPDLLLKYLPLIELLENPKPGTDYNEVIREFFKAQSAPRSPESSNTDEEEEASDQVGA